MQSLDINTKQIVYLKLDKIFPNPYQPRHYFEEASLTDLTNSIKTYGVINPITVRYVKGMYELVSGERRVKVCKRLGFEYIPSLIMNLSDLESASMALIENMQREKLSFIEEAEGLQNLMVHFGCTEEDLSKIVGKSVSSISEKTKVLNLNSEIKQCIIKNNLTQEHAMVLTQVEDIDCQKEILEKVIKFSLNPQKTESLIKKVLSIDNDKYSNRKIKGYISDVRIFTNTIKNAVETMKESGVNTDYSIEKKDDSYEIKIKFCM